MTIEAVGAVPIGQYKWKQFENYKQAIVDVCLKQEKPNVVESNVGTPIKNNLWESTFNFLDSDNVLIELKMWMLGALTEFGNTVSNTNYKFAITESWAHVTRPNGFHGPHRHPRSVWSGIFYVDADSTNNAHNTFLHHFALPRIPGYEFWNEQFDIRFEPGVLTIFPSTMLHYAPPYLGKDRRIVIAFNSIVL